MNCEKCGKKMKEETLFTSIEYSCNCGDDGWKTASDMLDLLRPMDLPIKLDFKDDDGTQGGVFIGNLDYFHRSPKGRKFKVRSHYDMGLKKGMTMDEVKQAIYGYSIDSDDDGC